MKKTMFRLFIAIMITASIVGCSSSKKADARQNRGEAPLTEELYAQMDSNKDGLLSKKEVKGPLANDFDKIDTNSDGFISAEELDKAPKPSGQRPQGGQEDNRGRLTETGK